MREYSEVCIVMQMTTRSARGRRQRVRRRRGAAPAPRSSGGRDRRPHRGQQRGRGARARCSRTWCRWPTACSSPPTPTTLAGHDVVFLGLPHGQSGAIAEALGEDVVVVDCGADFRLADSAVWEQFYGGEPRRHLAVRAARAAARRRHPAARPAARRQPGRGPGLLPDRLDPQPRSGAGGRAGRARPRRRRRVGHQRRGQGGQAPPAGQRGDGQRQRLRRRRRPPAHPGDHPEPGTARAGRAAR